MIGTFLYFLFLHELFVGKLLLTVLFVFLTAPVGAFMISRAAYKTGVKLWDKSKQDDLADAIKQQKARSK